MRIVALIVLALVMSVAGGDEEYRLEVHYQMTDDTICAHYKFDNFNSCNKFKQWIEIESAWHGKNTYRCIPKSQCPVGTK